MHGNSNPYIISDHIGTWLIFVELLLVFVLSICFSVIH